MSIEDRPVCHAGTNHALYFYMLGNLMMLLLPFNPAVLIHLVFSDDENMNSCARRVCVPLPLKTKSQDCCRN